MQRACKVTLKFATASKKARLRELLKCYRKAVNFFLPLAHRGEARLDKATLSLFTKTNLSERYKSQALKQALDVCRANRQRWGSKAKCPVFRGAAVLDAKFVSVEVGKKSFDLVLRLSSLRSGSKITIPSRKTAPLNKWLGKTNSRLIQGCSLSDTGIVVWVKIPDEKPKYGRVAGVDLGINKLLTVTEDGETATFFGSDTSRLLEKIVRSKSGSKTKRKLLRQRDNEIGRLLNQLPWDRMGVLAVEDLKYIKHGKKSNRNKSFRRKLSPWTYRQVLTRIEQKAQEHRVHLVRVDPRYTSQTCPKCGTVEKLNRNNQSFLCVSCGHAADADLVGATNIRQKGLVMTSGRVESPGLQKCN